MKYRVVFYCPDQHIMYDGGRLPDTKGVGGGVNARIRIAHALSKIGHEVTMICHCLAEELDRGVRYVPLKKTKKIDADVLVLTTSGDKLNLLPILDLDVSEKLRLLLIHGAPEPLGIRETSPDYFYPPSNFNREVVLNEWHGIPKDKIFVSYRGIPSEYFEQDPANPLIQRDAYRLVYVGNPIKGRQAAVEVVKILRISDEQYHLHTFGDEGLWGSNVNALHHETGVRHFGTVGQKELAQHLLTTSYGIFLQSIREGFANALVQAMYAGCIPIGSPAGAIQEHIKHNHNGFLVDGDKDEPVTWRRSAELIQNLQSNPAQLLQMRNNAQRWPLSWQLIAQTWEQHWDFIFGKVSRDQYLATEACLSCAGKLLHLADGYHCIKCGRYYKEL